MKMIRAIQSPSEERISQSPAPHKLFGKPHLRGLVHLLEFA